jgi:hypothetical protein
MCRAKKRPVVSPYAKEFSGAGVRFFAFFARTHMSPEHCNATARMAANTLERGASPDNEFYHRLNRALFSFATPAPSA